MAPLLIAKDYHKNVLRDPAFGTNEGNLAIGLSAGVFSLIIGVSLLRWCLHYRRVQREIKIYEREEAEEAVRRAQLAAAVFEKEKYLRHMAEHGFEFAVEGEQKVELYLCLEEDKSVETESTLSAPPNLAPEAIQDVGMTTELDEEKQIGLHDQPISLLSTNILTEDERPSATGTDGDGSGPPVRPFNEGSDTEPILTVDEAINEDEVYTSIPEICVLRIAGSPYRITNGNEADIF